jgi:hypothetical protein
VKQDRSLLGALRDRPRAGGCEVRGRSDRVDLDRLERLLQDPPESIGRVPEVVEVAPAGGTGTFQTARVMKPITQGS